MERKIDDVFEYHAKMLKVKLGVGCNGCYFIGRCIEHNCRITGECNPLKRQDNKKVIFVEVKDEQPQERAEQPKLNLCEILKYCPQGEQFWSPMLGDVIFYDINQSGGIVRVKMENGKILAIKTDGTITICGITSPEVMLYPSREQRDWTKVKYEPKKERFDPKTLKPFDKVLVTDVNLKLKWKVDFFSHETGATFYLYQCTGNMYGYCIPYNKETKHLVGTSDEAPEYYRYWED